FNTYATAVNNYHNSMVNHSRIEAMAIGMDRIWFSKEAGRVAPTEGIFSAFSKRVHELDGFPIVVHSREEMLQMTEKHMPHPAASIAALIKGLPAAERIPIKLLKYSPNALTFEAECATDGWLLVTDRWARSWQAEINGKPTELYCGNFI